MPETLTHIPWLTVSLALPLAGALFCALLRRSDQACRWTGLITTLAVFLLTLGLFILAPDQAGGPGGRWFLYEDAAWIDRFGIRYTLGLDGLNLLMLLLTGFLQVVAVLIAWPVTRRVPFFIALLLLLECGVIGVFLSLDLILFYLFWEVMLIPMFLLIMIWGYRNRNYAAIKFFLYTLAGSLLMLIGIIALHLLNLEQTGVPTFSLLTLRETLLDPTTEAWLFAAFMIAFAVKVPIFPFHTWLPDAHTEAPTAGSVDLAGLLLKTGAYAMLRFGFFLFPSAAMDSLPLFAVLALIGLFHASWVASVQQDIKRMIAYSSVAHLGLVILGFASWNILSIEGSILLMTAHGVTTGGLFALVAMLELRTGSRQLGDLGGLWHCAPRLSAIILLFSLSSLGLPGLANFSGEILILLGAFKAHPVWGILAMCGVVFAAIYTLRMVRGVLWGPQGKSVYCEDINLREATILIPMILFVLWIGLYPKTFLDPLHGHVKQIIASTGSINPNGGAQ